MTAMPLTGLDWQGDGAEPDRSGDGDTGQSTGQISSIAPMPYLFSVSETQKISPVG